MTSVIPAALALGPFTGAVIAAALALILPRFGQVWAALVMALTTATAAWGLIGALAEGSLRHRLGGWAAPLGIEYVLDPLSGFIALVIGVIGLLVIVYPTRIGFGTTVDKGLQLYPLILLLLGALMGVAVAGDLFNLFVSLEIYSIASYALIALGGPAAAVASFRYLLIGTAGSSIYLLGVGFIYFSTGHLSMGSVTPVLGTLTESVTIAAAAALILIGLGIKMALFPLHGWLPDAHSFAPPAVAALLAAVQVKVAAYALIRIMWDVFPSDYVTSGLPISTIITYSGLFGIVVGSVMAIRQSDIKRMLAHSTVAQLGYIAVGVGLGTTAALVGALVHVAAHAAMKSCLFFAAGAVNEAVGAKKIPQYAGLGPRMPLLMSGFTVAAISMVGLPPTAGFISKWYLISGATQTNRWLIAVVIVGASALTLVYVLRMLETIWFRPASAEFTDADIRRPGWAVTIPVGVVTLATLAIGVRSTEIVTEILEPMARDLLG